MSFSNEAESLSKATPLRLISPIPGFTRHATSHDDKGEAIIYSQTPGVWSSVGEDSIGFNVAYTTSKFPAELSDEADIDEHDELLATEKLGLVSAGGSVCRVVDFEPANDPVMHRTQSLDYGIVLDGEIELVLDSGDVRLLRKGDIALQRATMHAWRNPSATEWARMVFVLLDGNPLTAGRKLWRDDVPAVGVWAG
ncbi:hypothetical protein CDD83_1375 [Cordyceps sp. RAO-2017]|nr:hypothetical protein CDD83_1375 [Cordyceps sp. RAO-2017]